MSKNTYTGIVIGPIFQTIDRARKTREMWSSSFIFSYLSEKLVEAFNSDQAKNQLAVLSPHFETRTNKSGAGLYPDRIILQHLDKDNAPNTIRTIVKTVFQQLCKDIYDRSKQYDRLEEYKLIEETLASFFKLNAQTIHVEAGENIIETISPFLDSIEQVPQIYDLSKFENSLGHFLLHATLKNKDNGNKVSFLLEHAMGTNHEKFPSLIEIATRDLQELNGTEFKKAIEKHFKKINTGIRSGEDAQLFQDLTNIFGAKFLHQHRHIAIVHADGDNIGAVLKAIGDQPEEIKKFSKFLYDFALDATNQIIKYGGLPVYVGGDDVFFIAPVSRTSPNSIDEDLSPTILHLLQILDKKFTKAFRDLVPKIKALEKLEASEDFKQPTLSFGVNIEHVKSPLYEGIRQSRRLLLEIAKDKDRFPDKHVIALRQATHSGNDQEVYFQLNHQVLFHSCLDFMATYQQQHVQFLSTFSRRLFILHPFFEAIISDNDISIQKFITEMVKHESDKKKDFSMDQAITDILHVIYDKTYNEAFERQEKLDPDLNSRQQLLEFVLRFTHFLNRKIDF